MTTALETIATTEANQRKLGQLEARFQSLLAEFLQRGFFGNLTIELGIQDGTIQHVRSTVEQIER